MDHPTQESFRPIIEMRLAEIEAELSALSENTKPVVPDGAVGRLSRMDSMQMQQIALASRRRLEDQRGWLHEARRRIDAGNFGRCMICGGDIAIERLQQQPEAVACMPCLKATSARK